jgi:hypothetical protein
MPDIARRLIRAAACLLSCTAAVAALAAPPPSFTVAPVPAWVDRLTPDDTLRPAAGQNTDGVHYLLVDDQVRHDGRERVAYRHRALRAVNERGVEVAANIRIPFDPSFQRLTLHAVAVRRGSSVVSRLDPSAIRLLQRETALDALLYDGSVTASAFLNDVRVGDIVDYEYSLRGENPVFGGRQFGQLTLQWGVPVARLHARLQWVPGRAGRALQWKLNAGAPAGHEADAGALRERVWDLRDVPARTLENDAPGWFDPFWSAAWTEFDGWGSVARWALPLYDTQTPAAPAVAALAQRLGAASSDPVQRMLAVLRFVQGEIRYLGLEIGAGSHAPSRPDEVLRRRFGDCKDKTRLTIALLRELGIAAQPALVNTNVREGVRELLPTPGAFNHVLVRAQAGGRDWWLDPTRMPQLAEPEHLTQSDHGVTLIVDAASTQLVPMAGEQARRVEREVSAVLDASEGFDQPARFTVTTHLRGNAADSMRGSLAGTSRDDTQRSWLNYYAGFYRGARVALPFTVADNPGGNEITVVEHYEIPGFWTHDTERHRHQASIELPELAEQLRAPPSKVRDSPLARAHPLELRLRTEVRLPGEWSLQPATQSAAGSAFELTRKVDYSPKTRTLVLDDHYQSRRGHVDAADMPAHVAALDGAMAKLGFSLTHPDATAPAAAAASGPHWLVASLFGAAVVALAAGMVFVYRWDPAPWPLPRAGGEAMAPPRGIGGWLLPVALSLVVTPLRVVLEMQKSWPAYTSERWLLLTTPGGDAYHPLWAPLLVFELLANLTTIAALAVLVLLFFRRRSSVPRLFIAIMAWRLCVPLLDAALAGAIPATAGASDASELAGTVWSSLIGVGWMVYFVRSRRVAATFVERRATAAPAAPAAPLGVSATGA